MAQTAINEKSGEEIPKTKPARNLGKRLVGIVAGLTLLLLVSAVASVGFGAQAIPVGDLWQFFVNRLRGLAVNTSNPSEQIIWIFRIPRIALGALVGASLSMAGASLQGLLLNPLADPYLIGVSAGAAFGTTLAILMNIADFGGGMGRVLLGFATALFTLLIVYRLALKRGRIGRESFILAGIVVGSFMWALVTLLMAIARGGQLASVISLLLGDLGISAQWESVLVGSILFGFAAFALYAFSRDLNLLSLGEETAKQLGVEVERLKKIVIVLCALLTAAAVSISGVIGFVGLIIPHIARRLWGPDHRILLPASALLGASFMIWADALARRIIAPSELPVGVITSLLGAPFFCYLLVSSIRRSEKD